MLLLPLLPWIFKLSLVVAAPTPLEERQSCSTGITAARKSQVQSAFSASGVVPTLIPSINPQVDVSVSYGGKAVNLGNQFLTTETILAPSLSFSAEAGQSATTTYSYFLVDPDVPSAEGAPVVGLRMNYLHWYVSGAKSSCASSQSPTTVAIYQALTPASTTQHRYTFLVYREPAGYKPDIIAPQVRAGFNVNDYANKGGLVLVGGNFLKEAVTNGIAS